MDEKQPKPEWFETVMILKPDINIKEKISKYEYYLSMYSTDVYKSDIGEKHLAYKVKEYEYGYYLMFICRCDQEFINTKLDLKLRQDDDVLKFMSMDKPEAGISKDEAERYVRVCSDSKARHRNINAMDVLLGLATYD